MILTGWFPPRLKPCSDAAHQGPYEVKRFYGRTACKGPLFAWWDGEQWLEGHSRPEDCSPDDHYNGWQSRGWRGVKAT